MSLLSEGVMTTKTLQKSELIKFDYIIKHLLKSKDKRDIFIIGDLINAVLGYYNYPELEIIGLHDPESLSIVRENKTSIADFLAKDKEGRYHIIEVESSPKHRFLHKAIFNTSATIFGSHVSGKPYDVKKVFHMTIMFGGSEIGYDSTAGSEQLEERGVISRFETVIFNKDENVVKPLGYLVAPDNYGELFPSYFCIDVNKFIFNKDVDTIRKLAKLEQWLYMLKYNSIKDYFSISLKEAREKWNILKMSDEERADYIHYMKVCGKMLLDVEMAEEERDQAKMEAEKVKREAEKVKREAEEVKRKAEEVERKAEEVERKAEKVKRKAEEEKKEAKEMIAETAQIVDGIIVMMYNNGTPVDKIAEGVSKPVSYIRKVLFKAGFERFKL